MGNKLKPKEVNEVLEELTNAVIELNNSMSSFQTPTATNVTYDNTASDLSANDVQDAIDELDGDIGDLSTALTDAVPIKMISVPNIGQHKSIKLTLGDTDVFCLVCVVGGVGSKAVYLISNGTGAGVLLESDYSVTKNTDLEFTITSGGNWSRAIIFAFSPIANPVTYQILN